MENKLLNYGLSTDQTKELLKGKKIKTIHGEYKLKNNDLILTRSDKTQKTIKL